MKNLFFAFTLLLSTLLLTSCAKEIKNHKQVERPAINVMAYYVPERDSHPENLPLDQLTPIIFSFTNVIEGEMKFRDRVNESRLKALVDYRKKEPQFKGIVAG